MSFSFSSCGIPASTLQPLIAEANLYRKRLAQLLTSDLNDCPEASLFLPTTEAVEQIQTAASPFQTSTLRTVVVIGIGGSNLGTQAIYEALPHKGVSLVFLETVSSTMFQHVLHTLQSHKSKKSFLIIMISKSGGTTETVANTEALLHALKPTFGSVQDRLVVITDEGSALHAQAKKKRLVHLTIPPRAGGRFSVFSAVGLFPLAVAGFDIGLLCEGARDTITKGIAPKNAAMTFAAIAHAHAQAGTKTHVSFFFAPELEYVGRWERQLIGESLGKEKDIEGTIVNYGITPIVSIGSTDLHSMAQLYLAGPKDKFTLFISVDSSPQLVRVPRTLAFPGLVDHVAGTSFLDLFSAIKNGVVAAYRKQSRPFVTFTFDQLNEKALGEYLQWRMMEIMYHAHLAHINAFDQPAVELYKIETKRRLASL